MTAASILAEHLKTRLPNQSALMELAHTMGVPGRMASRAWCGRKVNAADHVALCSAIGFDPVYRRDVVAVRHPIDLQWPMLKGGLVLKRHQLGLGLRGVERAAGVSASTLSRLERDEPIATEGYLALCRWLGWSGLSCILLRRETSAADIVTRETPTGTPERLAA